MKTNILIIEEYQLLFEGLKKILTDGNKDVIIWWAKSTKSAEVILEKQHITIAIANPLLLKTEESLFCKFKNHFANIRWIAFVHDYIPNDQLNTFVGTIEIGQEPSLIRSIFQKTIFDNREEQPKDKSSHLSEREINVLKLLIDGYSNKEVADKLSLSTHTVISHRKNISIKTGIKSLAGLTIYAILNNIITIENGEE